MGRPRGRRLVVERLRAARLQKIRPRARRAFRARLCGQFLAGGAGTILGRSGQSGEPAAQALGWRGQGRGRGRLSRRLRGLRSVSPGAFRSCPGALSAEFPDLSHVDRPPSESCPIMESYRTSPPHDKQGGLFATKRDKAPPTIHHAHVIRAELDPLSDPAPTLREGGATTLPRRARAKPSAAKAPERQAFTPPAPVPSWARASGRAGQGEPLFAAGASLALIDACLRRDPPYAGTLRSRLALLSAGACAKILRLNADAAALRDLRFATGDNRRPGGEAAAAVARVRRPAAQSRPRPDYRRGGAPRPRAA